MAISPRLAARTFWNLHSDTSRSLPFIQRWVVLRKKGGRKTACPAARQPLPAIHDRSQLCIIIHKTPVFCNPFPVKMQNSAKRTARRGLFRSALLKWTKVRVRRTVPAFQEKEGGISSGRGQKNPPRTEGPGRRGESAQLCRIPCKPLSEFRSRGWLEDTDMDHGIKID